MARSTVFTDLCMNSFEQSVLKSDVSQAVLQKKLKQNLCSFASFPRSFWKVIIYGEHIGHHWRHGLLCPTISALDDRISEAYSTSLPAGLFCHSTHLHSEPVPTFFSSTTITSEEVSIISLRLKLLTISSTCSLLRQHMQITTTLFILKSDHQNVSLVLNLLWF